LPPIFLKHTQERLRVDPELSEEGIPDLESSEALTVL
jgi:hypothetical protein